VSKRTISKQAALEFTSLADLAGVSGMRLDLRLVPWSGVEIDREPGAPRPAAAKVKAKVGSVRVKPKW